MVTIPIQEIESVNTHNEVSHIQQLSDFKKIFFYIHKIHASTLEAGLPCSVMERQITFKPFPGSSRNGQHDIYFHVKCNNLIRPFSWYKVGGLTSHIKPLAMKILAHSNNPGTNFLTNPGYTRLDCSFLEYFS